MFERVLWCLVVPALLGGDCCCSAGSEAPEDNGGSSGWPSGTHQTPESHGVSSSSVGAVLVCSLNNNNIIYLYSAWINSIALTGALCKCTNSS